MSNPELNLNQSDAQSVLNQIVLDHLREQKRKQRWRWISRLFFFSMFVFVVYQVSSSRLDNLSQAAQAHVGLIDISGTIFDGQSANADDFAKGLDAAYDSKSMKALILRINSPGGSPVQADYMFKTIRYYQKQHPDVKVYSVCVDMCASAAYYIAAAADDIYADESSLVGSIGVVYNGFGFVGTMEKLGITRRMQTAGKYKGILDPFSPETPEQQQKLQNMLDQVHQQFIAKVKEGRGKRLLIDDDTFSGLFWTGIDAKKRGLIDGFGSAGQVAREIIKNENLVDYTHQESMFEKVSKSIGTAMADHLPEALGMKGGFQ